MNNKRNSVIGVLLLLVVMTIGYALFSETVTIGGTAKGKGNLSIIFTNPGAGGNNIAVREHGSHGATATIEENGKKLNIQIPNMEYPTSYVEIPVKIKNNGTIKGYVKKITPDKLDTTNIKVTYTPLKDYYMLNPNDVKDFIIKVEWDKDSINKVTTSFGLKIEYEQSVTTDSETDYIPKYYAVGEEVCLNGKEDCFNVIKDNGDSVTMLAKYNLTLDGQNQYNIRTQSAAIAKQNINKKPNNKYGYWTDDNGDIIRTYGSKYPVDVYNKAPNSNPHLLDDNEVVIMINNYVNKLKGIRGITDKISIIGRLIYYGELVELGFPADGGYCTNKEYEKWIDNGQYWWTGSALDYENMYILLSDALLTRARFYNPCAGVRPVITIDKKYL